MTSPEKEITNLKALIIDERMAHDAELTELRRRLAAYEAFVAEFDDSGALDLKTLGAARAALDWLPEGDE